MVEWIAKRRNVKVADRNKNKSSDFLSLFGKYFPNNDKN